ncbi:general transcription factor 3C polypeptide 1-like isoform X2 [Corticium candelabrum]|uniref:general transcription factor 3C polypeptide 1-like isoform X2 n=1 Tax=Corticium candelabrum TaxID=121492 RepID=UPI002E265FE1|nr:general transcription factor 3C polypeptide 1-like isoform X2 [Corticium candelabrum]
MNIGDVLEEIALEGLAGCRVNELWQRLEARSGANVSVEDRENIWKILSEHSRDVTFHVNTHRYQVSDAAEAKFKPRGSKLGADAVCDSETGDRGMCREYSGRQDVSLLVSGMSFDEVTETWGDSLVVVASQDLRLFSLIGSYHDPCCFLYDTEYMALEVIGKHRSNGITRVELAKTLGVDGKAIFYPVQVLKSKRLIMQRKELARSVKTTRIYLTRFYRAADKEVTVWDQRKTLCSFLERQPNKTANYKEISKLIFNNNSKQFKKARELLVRNCTVEKYETANKTSRTLTLLKPYIDNDLDDDDSDVEDSDPHSVNDDKRKTRVEGRVYCPKWMDTKIVAEKCLLTQFYEKIEAAGSQGMTQQELAQQFDLSRPYARNGLHVLHDMNVLRLFVEDKGRQQTERHVALLPVKKSVTTNIITRTTSPAMDSCMPSQSNSESQLTPDAVASTIKTETLRMGGQVLAVNRKAWLRQFIDEHNVVYGVSDMTAGLREYEAQHGREHSICRKTIMRALSELITAGEIDTLTTEISGQACHFYMKKGLSTSSEAFQTVAGHLRLSFDAKKTTAGIARKKKARKQCVVDSTSVEHLQENVSQCPPLTTQATATAMLTDENPTKEGSLTQEMMNNNHNTDTEAPVSIQVEGERLFTLMPKFQRFRALHRYLWEGLHSSNEIAFQLPASSKGEGWVLLSVAVNCMPVDTFLATIGFSGKSYELETFLQDSKNAKTTISNLPDTISTLLCAKKPHVFVTMYNMVKNLEGLRLLKVVEGSGSRHYGNTHLSVEPKVALLDTREASPAYCHLLWSEAKSFPWKEFLLSHLSDLDQVWFDMERICANTQLGKRNFKSERESVAFKSKRKEGPVEPVNFDQLQDDDVIGAAGLPWQFFAHIRRSWTNAVYQAAPGATASTIALKTMRDTESVKTVQVVVPPGKKLNEERRGGKGQKRVRFTAEKGSAAKKTKVPKKVTPHLTRKKLPLKMRGGIRDAQDLAAKSLKKKLRVKFSSQEDNLILICGAAKDFIKKHFRYDPAWIDVRNVYQEIAGSVAFDKTSYAIQRRLAYMRHRSLISAQRLQSVLAELDQDKQFVKRNAKSHAEYLEIYKEIIVKLWRKHGGKLDLPCNLPSASVPSIPNSFARLQAEFNFRLDSKPDGSIAKCFVPNDCDAVFVRRSLLQNLLLSVYSKSDKPAKHSSLQLYHLLESYPEEDLQAVYEDLKTTNTLVRMKMNSKEDDITFQSNLKLGSSYHRLFVVDCPREIFSDVIDIESLPTCDYMDFDDNSFSTTDATSLSLEHQTASNELQNNLTANKQLNSADHCGTASLDLSQVNGSCIAQLLPKMFTSEVYVDAQLPAALFDAVDCSNTKSGEKQDADVGILSSEDEELRNDDTKKGCTWTESLQDYLKVPEQGEAKDSFITISSCDMEMNNIMKHDSTLTVSNVRKDTSTTLWATSDSTELEMDVAFEDVCITDDELVVVCQKLEWQADEISDLLVILVEVRNKGWQGIETQSLMNDLTLQHSIQSSMSLEYLVQMLLNFRKVHKVGFATERLVCHEACHLWHFKAIGSNIQKQILESNSANQEASVASLVSAGHDRIEEKWLVKSRPWIACSGSLNNHQLTYLLQAVLNQIMWKPGITKDMIEREIGRVVHPAALDDLLEFLELSNCIERHLMQQIDRPTLFSRPFSLLPGNRHSTSSVTHLFATADCVSCLAKAMKSEEISRV